MQGENSRKHALQLRLLCPSRRVAEHQCCMGAGGGGGTHLQARIAQSFDVAVQPAPIISVKGRFVRAQVRLSAAIRMASSTRSDSSYCSG